MLFSCFLPCLWAFWRFFSWGKRYFYLWREKKKYNQIYSENKDKNRLNR